MPHNCPCSGVHTHSHKKKKQASQWEGLMKKFSEKHKEKCKRANPEAASNTYTVKDFPTGSSYEGGYEDMQMRGYGEYTYPNGVLYRGEFENGMCHGDGELIYEADHEDFTVIRGNWEDGILKDGRIFLGGNLEYDIDDWKYCKMPDRRYATEFDKELQPAGMSNITSEQPPREIPPGHIDNGYGFYNPETKFIYKYNNVLEVAKATSKREQIWSEDNCRMEPMSRVGPRPDLYETWLEPDVDPPALPGLLVGFTPIKQQSIFRYDSTADNALFYDSATWWNLHRFEKS